MTTPVDPPPSAHASWADRLDARLAGRGGLVALALVLALALALRGVFHAQAAATEDFGRLAVDAAGYDEQARGVLDGTWPGDAVFYQDALYPYFLAAHYRWLGDAPADVFRTQLVLGLGVVALVFGLGRLVFGPTEGLLASLLAASYGVFLYYETLLLKATLSTFALAAFLVLVVLARRRESRALALAAGLALGACCLLRGNLLALVPVAAVWFAWPRAGATFARRLQQTVLVGLGAGLAISPITLHNLRAGELVLITSQAGQNFYIGNNPHNELGSYVPPPGVRGVQTYEQVDFARLAEEDVGRPLSVRERSAYWFERAFAWMRAEPGPALALLGKKALLLCNHVEVPDNADYETTRREVPLLRLPLPEFWFVFVAAAAALALVRWTPPATLTVVVAATIAATVVAFYVFSRYRLPLVPLLMILAAGLPRALTARLRARDWPRLLLAVALTALAGWATSRTVWDGTRSMLHYNRALFALEEEDADAARAHLERALAEEPDNGYALTLRGQLRVDAGDVPGGLADLRAGAAATTGQAEPHYKLGLALEEHGDAAAAADAYRAALAVQPTYDVSSVRLAALEARAGDARGAYTRLETLLARRPRFFPALKLLGSLRLEAGLHADALEVLERAAALRPDDPAVARDLLRCRRALEAGG